MKTEHLFVYGTLAGTPSTTESRLLKRKTEIVGEAILPGAILYDLGEYPGAVRSRKRDAAVGGELLACAADEMAELLKALDKYEEFDPASPGSSLFLRRRERVRANGRDVTAWVYWYNGPMDKAVPLPTGRYVRQPNIRNRPEKAA